MGFEMPRSNGRIPVRLQDYGAALVSLSLAVLSGFALYWQVVSDENSRPFSIRIDLKNVKAMPPTSEQAFVKDELPSAAAPAPTSRQLLPSNVFPDLRGEGMGAINNSETHKSEVLISDFSLPESPVDILVKKDVVFLEKIAFLTKYLFR